MAKKIKKVVKKAATSRKTTPVNHKRWDNHDFLIVVAGGFIVISIIFILSDSFRTRLGEYVGSPKKAPMEQIVVENQNEKTITIQDFAYAPDPLVIKKGTTVTWTNNDEDTHSATADDGSFNTQLLQKGESGSVTFNDVGEHPYHCSVHPNMVGKIVVEE